MPRVTLSRFPLPVLAVLVAVSACSKPRSEEVSHVIPPPAPYLVPAAIARDPSPGPAAPSGPAPADDAPTPEEVKAFERPVRK